MNLLTGNPNLQTVYKVYCAFGQAFTMANWL